MDEVEKKRSLGKNSVPTFLKKNSVKLAPIQTIRRTSNDSSKDTEVWDVKNLRYNTVQEEYEPSAALVRLANSRRKQHDNALSEMNEELKEANQEAEKQIQHESDVLKLVICDIYRNNQNVVQIFTSSTMSLLSEHQVSEHWIKLRSLILKEKSAIDKHYETLRRIEKERVEKVKVILRKYYQILGSISFYLPFNLQEFFEELMLNMNQITVNNLRCYADLHKHLSMIVAKKITKCKHHIAQPKTSSETLQLSTRTVSSIKLHLDQLSSMEFMKRVDFRLLKIADLLARYQGQSAGSYAPLPGLSSNLETAISYLSNMVQNMLSLYKQVLINMFTGGSDILANLHQDIQNTGIYNQESALLLFRPSVILDESNIDERPISHLTNVETVSIEVMMKIQLAVKELFRFMYDASSPWDSMQKRSQEAQCLLHKQIKKLIGSCIQKISDNEVKLNILFDRLRQESSEDELNEVLFIVIDTLNDAMMSYEKDYEVEKSIIEKYYDLLESQYQLLSLEIGIFMLKNPQEEFKAYHSQELEPEEQSIYIPQALRICEAQVSSLYKWKYGLWEAVKFGMKNAYSASEERTSKWVDDNLAKALNRLELKIKLHTPRYSRILSEMYLVRQAELKLHYERFLMHKEGVQSCLIEVTEKLEALVTKHTDDVKTQHERIETIWKEGKDTFKLGSISILNTEIQKLCDEFSEEADSSLISFEDQCFCKLAWLREANLNFLKAVRLFAEGGNFCPEKVEQLTQQLEYLNKNIDQFEDDIGKQIKKYKISLPQIASTAFKEISNDLQLVLADLTFIDNVVGLIKMCQRDLKSEVFKLKYRGRILQQKISCAIVLDSNQIKSVNMESHVQDQVKKNEVNKSTSKAVAYLQNKLQILEASRSKLSQKSSKIYSSDFSFKGLGQLKYSPIIHPHSRKNSNSHNKEVISENKKGIYSRKDQTLQWKSTESTKALNQSNQALTITELKKSVTKHKKIEIQSSHLMPPHFKQKPSLIEVSNSHLTKSNQVLIDKILTQEHLIEDEISEAISLESSRLPSTFTLWLKNWTDLLHSLLERRDYLLQPASLMSQVSARSSKENIPLTPLQLKYSSHLQVLDKKSIPLSVGTKSYYNYEGMLFGTPNPPPSENTFMSRVCSSLWNAFNKIQKTTADYFAEKGSKPIVKTDVIQPTYNKFVEEVLTKFKYYHQQCEDVWLQQVEDFLNLVTEIQSSAKKYGEQFIIDYHANKLHQTERYLLALLLKLDDDLDDNAAQLKELEDKLKPLHGYPGNNMLLKELNNEVLETFEKLKESMLSLIAKNKSEIEEMYTLAKNEAMKTWEMLESMLKQMFAPSITENLKEQKKFYEVVKEQGLQKQSKNDLKRKESVKKKGSKKTSFKKPDQNKVKGKKGKPLEEKVEAITPDLNEHLPREPVPSRHRLSLDSGKLNEEIGSKSMCIPEHPKKQGREVKDLEPETKPMESEVLSQPKKELQVIYLTAAQRSSSLSKKTDSSVKETACIVELQVTADASPSQETEFSVREAASIMESQEVTNTSPTQKMEYFVKESTSTVESQEIDESEDKNLKEYTLMFDEVIEILDEERTKYENKTEHWLQIWNSNIEKVLQLYNIEFSNCQIKYCQELMLRKAQQKIQEDAAQEIYISKQKGSSKEKKDKAGKGKKKKDKSSAPDKQKVKKKQKK